MRKRFRSQKNESSSLRSALFTAVAAGLMVIFLILGMGTVSDATQAEKLKTAKSAVTRAVVQCYALEGQYPISLDYLANNYGLVLYTDRYVYHYQTLGENIMPEISVFSIQ